MAKQPLTRMLERWIALDGELARTNSDGLDIGRFAYLWKVSVKTVRRDLKVLARVWCPVEREWNGWCKVYYWYYEGLGTGDGLFNPGAHRRYFRN
jgi:hypothetical protein